MNLTDEQLQTIKDLELFAPKFLWIKPKKGGNLVSFNFKKAQKFLHRKIEEQRIATSGKVRCIICKGRQLGGSTYVQARYFHQIIKRKGVKAYILTHRQHATDNIFGITDTFYENLPQGLIPQANTKNAKKLFFSYNNSGYGVGTVGSGTSGVGRSETIQLFHGSEVGLWENAEEIAEGIMQCISDSEGTEIILESTAQGIGNYFHIMWTKAVAGENSFMPIFLPWYWDEDYVASTENFILTDEEEFLLNCYKHDGLTTENLAWRRRKISDIPNLDREIATYSFQQEYPMNAEEAFRKPLENSFISSKYVQKARKQEVNSENNLIIGVDVAVSDKDWTAIIRRRGRCAYNLQKVKNHNTMEIVGLLRRIIAEENPRKIYVDWIGFGAGVVDRLREMGYMFVEAVNVARTANDKEKFRNVRAELWSEMRDWFCGELPVQIPDRDDLHGELCCLSAKTNSSGQLVIQSKDEIRSQGLPSPDGADALSLTFFGGAYGGNTYQFDVSTLPKHERAMFR